MEPFVFQNWQGIRFQLCDTTNIPLVNLGWEHQDFLPGQAVLFVQTLDTNQIQRLHMWLRNNSLGAFSLGALSGDQHHRVAQLLETRKLRLYREPQRLSKEAVTSESVSIEALHLQIRAELKQILARERQEAQQLDQSYKKDSTAQKAVAHAKAGGLGVIEAGTALLSWLSEINDAVNPLWRLKRRVEAALETYEEYINDTDGAFNYGLVRQYLHRVEIKDHKELVEALGFDPASIDFDAFSEAWHTAWLLAGDQVIVDMFTVFAKDYVGAQHSLELTKASGGVVFELLLTILLAVATGGIGAAASIGSKARYAGTFGRIGKKLKALANLLADKPRQVKIRRRQRVKVGKQQSVSETKQAASTSDEKELGSSKPPPPDRQDSDVDQKPNAMQGKTVDELIDTELNSFNSLNGLEGEAFKNNALIDYHLNADMDILTKDEYMSLTVYTTNLYGPINNGLRGLSPSDKVKWSKVSADADSALAKLSENPDLRHEGDVIRGDTFNDELLDELFPVGGEHQDMGFKSSTHNMEKPFIGNTTTIIKSKSGVKIEDVAVLKSEEEVLFRPGTSFKVLSREKVDGHNYIELEEI